MGVGVYSNDFDGTGGTFIVNAPNLTDADYVEYVTDCQSSGIEPVNHDDWMQDAYDDENSFLIETIEAVGRSLGLTVLERNGYLPRYPSKNFDDNFISVIDDTVITAGWRSWESDLIVGVAVDKSLRAPFAEPNAHEIELFDQFGRYPDAITRCATELSSAVQRYLLLSCLQNGLDCSFRTSAWTTSPYSIAPDEIAVELASLPSKIKAHYLELSLSPEEAKKTLSPGERAQIVAMLHRVHDPLFRVAIPFYCVAKNAVIWKDGFDDETLFSSPCPADLKLAMNDLLSNQVDTMSGCGMIPVPLNEQTAGFFADDKQGKSWKLQPFIVSMQEFMSAAGEEPTFVFSEEDTGGHAVTLDCHDGRVEVIIDVALDMRAA